MRQFQPPPGQTGFPHRQPPQYPPQTGTNTSPQQSFSSQQFQRPLFDLPQGQPQTPKRNPRKRLSFAALVVLAVIVAAFDYGSHPFAIFRPTTQPAHPASRSTSASTSAPASQATPQPTTGAIPAPTILGSDIANFVSRYGQPNNHSVTSAGYYHFRRYASSNLDFLIVQADVADGGVYAQRVKGVMAQAPGAGWKQQEASSACATFLPRDAVYERTVVLANGYDKVYFSASLAGSFRASAFTDPNGSQVKAGLFDVQYIYRSGKIIDSCEILIGTEQTQS